MKLLSVAPSLLESTITSKIISEGEDKVIEEVVSLERRTEVGQLFSLDSAWEALIVAEGWPSWSFAVQGLGFTRVRTKLINTNLTVSQEFKHTSVSSTVTRLPLEQLIKEKRDNCLILIQTTQPTLTRLINESKQLLNNSFIFVCRDQNFLCGECSRISHAEVGGVIRGSWSFYTHKLSPFELNIGKVRRTLGHILDYTQGKDKKKSIDSPHCLEVPDRVPFGCQQVKVKCQSVFYGDELIRRTLSTKELFNAYDLELKVQGELGNYYKQLGFPPTHSFTHQVPIKVLRCILMSWTKQLFTSDNDGN